MNHPSEYLSFNIDFELPEVVSLYDELPLWSSAFGNLLLRHMPLKETMTVLDVGSGTGFPLLEIAQRLGSSSKIFGIDPWESAVNRARQKVKSRNISNTDIILGDASEMPFENEYFDLIVSNLGINNFENPVKVMNECWRVTKPTGRIVLTTNLKGHMNEFYDVYKSTLVSCGKELYIGKLEEHIDARATVSSIESLFNKTGFNVTKVQLESTQMRFSNGSSFFRHFFIKLGFLEAWKSILNSDDQELVFIELEKNLNSYASTKGELMVTIPMAYIEGERCARS